MKTEFSLLVYLYFIILRTHTVSKAIKRDLFREILKIILNL